MKYALLIYSDYSSDAGQDRTEESLREMYAQFGRFTEELRAAGKLGPAEELASPAQAKSVRLRDGAPVVTDGPFAEVREQLGGFYIIEARDDDEAIEWAAKVPTAAYGTIEVRPLAPPMRESAA
jgi:hypothetical protein